MNEVLNKIQSQVGAANLSTSCSRDGCRVYLTDVPSTRVIVDIDKVFPTSTAEGRQGDYVLFFMDAIKNALITVPMELKSGDVDASKAHKQLQQAATCAEKLTKDSKPICHPILFHVKSIHPKQRKTLNRAKVRFHGRQLTIKTARCGRPRNLTLALKEK